MLAAKTIRARHSGDARTATTLCVWHSTAGASAESSISWMNRPGGAAVSYHFLIERDGTVVAHAPLGRVAYHAGRSAWPVPESGVPAGSSVNGRSIGIAFANRNMPAVDRAFERVTEAQVAAAVALAAKLAKNYPRLADIRAHVRHRDVAPGRKTDPEPDTLDWRAFHARLWDALQGAGA